MNNKEFTSELSNRMNVSAKETGELISTLIKGMTHQLQDGNVIGIHTFGTFEVKKKSERITVNPLTKQRFLVPPKLVLSFRPSAVLKDKFKQ